MLRFSAGDRVRFTENCDGVKYGTESVVRGHDRDGNPILELDPEGDIYGWGLVLELITDESDPINHPDHYQSESGIECIDAIRAALTPEEFRGYCKGAALKYIWRERKKGENESLGKGVWYLNEAQK